MLLTSQAARVATLLAIIDLTSSMKPAQVLKLAKETVNKEVQTRRRNAPCVAEDKCFDSTIEAARYLAHHRRDLWVNSKAAARMDAHAVMENLRNRVKNWCNADDVPGYYWI